MEIHHKNILFAIQMAKYITLHNVKHCITMTGRRNDNI